MDDAIALPREFADESEQLGTLGASAVQHAKANDAALTPTEAGGRRFTAKGGDGGVARVGFPAAALVSEIEAQGEIAQQARTLAGEHSALSRAEMSCMSKMTRNTGQTGVALGWRLDRAERVSEPVEELGFGAKFLG